MENGKEHHELMTTIAVFQERMDGKLNAINNHLASLNGQTSKNTQAVSDLQRNQETIGSLVYKQRQEEAKQEAKEDGWKKRWQDLIFGTLQWIIPAIIIGVLANGNAILKFLGLSK